MQVMKINLIFFIDLPKLFVATVLSFKESTKTKGNNRVSKINQNVIHYLK